MKALKDIAIFSILFAITFFSGSLFTRADSIGSDTLNVGGGAVSGGDYILNDSIGQNEAGLNSGGDYILNDGFQQNFVTGTFINIDVTPSGGTVTNSEISGFMSGQIGDGYADVKVTTDYDGYSLAIKSSTDPALKCNTSSGCDASDVFANYTPASGAGTPDYAWSVANNASEFGYTAKGSDILANFKYDTQGSSCGAGSTDIAGDYCWDALLTGDTNISSASASNSPDGTTTRVKFRSQVGSSKLQPSGSYKASVTVTATANS